MPIFFFPQAFLKSKCLYFFFHRHFQNQNANIFFSTGTFKIKMPIFFFPRALSKSKCLYFFFYGHFQNQNAYFFFFSTGIFKIKMPIFFFPQAFWHLTNVNICEDSAKRTDNPCKGRPACLPVFCEDSVRPSSRFLQRLCRLQNKTGKNQVMKI